MQDGPRLVSSLCTAASLESPVFLAWAERLRPAWDHAESGWPTLTHRKLWEWIFIAQALEERGMLGPGRRGLGFGVGQEPLTAVFAAAGCEIVASDVDQGHASSAGWAGSGQHAAALADLNRDGLCDPDVFARNVSFRVADMNAIPRDLAHGAFDFTWSSCAFEHLGSIAHGQEFLLRQMACLRPGGVAVHTTEFNVSSNSHTVNYSHTVLFRRRDLEWIVDQLGRANHRISLDLDPGESPADRHVDAPPYSNTHLKVRLGRYTTTSLGLIIEKNPYEVGRRHVPDMVWRGRRRARTEWSRLAQRAGRVLPRLTGGSAGDPDA
ncbi:MAG: class I SAM-dependent methyltransferase [Acidimicrobiales bacterium]